MNDNNDPVDYNQFGQAYNNAAYVATSAIQLRLDTQQVVKDFEMYLKGKMVQYTQLDNGEIVEEVLWKGEPVVNQIGYQAIMQFIHLTINNQVVQGNFIDEDMYADYICRTRKDLSTDLMVNRQRYGLEVNDYPGLMSRVMRIIELFMTRPLFNKERDSYNASMRISESLQTGGNKGSWFSLPFGGGKR